jgi:hypothetical protein
MIKVEVVWMENISSRNAFYQVFSFRPDNGYDCKTGPVTVTHYGPMKLGVVAFHRPVLGGKVTIFPVNCLEEKVGAKLSRGYQMRNHKVASVQMNDPWFTDQFGAAQAFDLNQAIFMGAAGPGWEPSAATDTVIVPDAGPEIEKRPDSWGTW